MQGCYILKPVKYIIKTDQRLDNFINYITKRQDLSNWNDDNNLRKILHVNALNIKYWSTTFTVE